MISSWRVEPLGTLTGLAAARADGRRPSLVAVDGHSSSGKTSLAARLAAALPGAAVLHTDDLAWHQGVFSWDRLLLDDVLPVVLAGEPLDYAPPAWQARQRAGSIRLPRLDVLIVEGVGTSQPSVRDAFDVLIWVETEELSRLERDHQRVAVAGETSAASYAGWMAEENAYVVTERPWRHADAVVYGGLAVAHNREHEVVLARLSD